MEQKVIIITGASSGIGLACVKEFVKRKSIVVLAARSIEKLKVIEDQLHSEGHQVLTVQTDVSQEKECEALINKTIEVYGRIDVLINNAGISMRALFEDVDIKVLKQLMAVNFWGTVYCTKYALPYIIRTKGSIVGVTSLAGFKGLPGRTGYSASKFAMQGFLETVRAENYKKGIHVMIAAPDFTRSEIRKQALNETGHAQIKTPKDESKLMSAEEVASRIYRGVKKRKRTIIMSAKGKLLLIMKLLAPSLLDRISYREMAQEPDSPFQ